MKEAIENERTNTNKKERKKERKLVLNDEFYNCLLSVFFAQFGEEEKPV